MNLTTRQKQAVATQKRIQKTALQLFAENSYETVTVAQICKAAQVSVGTFYHYYDSKEAVLMIEYSTFDDFVEKDFHKKDHSSNVDALLELMEQRTYAIDEFGSTILSQIMQIELRREEEYAQLLDENRPFLKEMKLLTQQAIDAGELSSRIDADELARLILRQYRGIVYDWVLRDGEYDIGQRILQDLRLLLDGLKQL